MSQGPIPPHPPLDLHYKNEADRPRFVSELFDAGAPYYETICKIMSFGSGGWYRGEALRSAGLSEGMRVLDVATGTGLVLRSAVAIGGPQGFVVGLDPSAGMLRECRRRSAVPLVRGLGEQLPFQDGIFDLVSMGYGLRHVADLGAVFAEYRRVLKPRGRVLALELTQPTSSVGRWFNRLCMGTLLPGVAYHATGRASARRMMDYFWDTIENCVPPDVILGAIRDAGFTDVTRAITGGVLSEYRGTAPAAALRSEDPAG
jgi:demethylmenaquinone methyltransferase/2-methoxy-6-polyprenyl-1,4-benzoquinol methylase